MIWLLLLVQDPLPEGAVARLGTTRLRHDGMITAIAFAPDGKSIASASLDGSIRIWEIPGGRLLRRIDGHDGQGVLSVAFASDGRLVSAGKDRMVRVWNGEKEIARIDTPDNPPRQALFSPDGKTVAVVGNDVRIWESDRVVATLDVRALRAAWLGTSLAVAGVEGATRIWDPATGRVIPLDHFAGAVDCSGDRIVTAGKSIRIWDATGRELQVMQAKANVAVVVFSPDRRSIAAAAESSIQIWTEGKLTLKLVGHHGAVSAVAFSPDGKTLASAGSDRVLRLWSIPPKDESTAVHTGSVHSVRWAKDGTLATASADRSVILWKDGRFLKRLSGHEDTVFDVAFSPDGATLASAGADRTIRIWSREGELRKWPAHDGAVYALAFGARIFSAGEDRTLRSWDPETGREIARAEDAGAVLCLALEGDRLASGGTASHVRLWSLDLKDEGNVPGNDLCTYGVSITSSGTIASGGGDQTVRVGTTVLRGHDQIVYSVSLSPDAKLVASGGWDGTVRVWEIDSEREVLILRGHSGPVYSVAFSPDGARLASGGHDMTALLWDARPVATLTPETAWDALAGDDPAKAYRAIGALTAGFLKSRIPSGDPRKLISDLDDPDIETRERAFEELRDLGDVAEKALREAKESEPVGRLLGLLSKPPRENPHLLRRLRAIQALERLGATDVLEMLVERGTSARERADAKAAVGRLKRR